MTRRIAATILAACAAIALLAGCEMTQTQARAREAAVAQWNAARAGVKAQLAHDQFAAGRIEAAAAELQQALELDPQHPGLRLLEARILLARGDIAGAHQRLLTLDRTGPLGAEVEYLLGVVQQQRLAWDAAAEHYTAALRQSPAEPAYLAAAVQALLQCGQTDRAGDLLIEHHDALGWTPAYIAAAAELAEQQGAWDQAAQLWGRLLDGRKDAGVRERRALALYRNDQWEEAARELSAILEAAADEQVDVAALRLALADCELERGDAISARRHAGAVLKTQPDNPVALRLLARALLADGQITQARLAAERAWRLDPDDLTGAELAATLAYRDGDHHLAATRAAAILQTPAGHDSPIARRILALSH